ncbi:hypothetical protein A3H89_01460 [Candidatus Amesbacteria bacterium RIFCSPLOWO2_02_FULL_48_11]|uniref:Ribbon-helix-helix protein CopG domain-containing protein n=1 Tax=Candidatus Amesbacteria bacterium RIFOXYD1_FULL_47_9 TaxID=1797267 RepID=A0A1F4ZZD0_9BACT|nr:MAG: hypothetical protein A2W16_01100 [Candidatus Amesbacteria bacterium RBG_16_48_31]OGD08767.1 MAG: hypothetical protein A3H89_01460 [Candidatus Amesbacteria bacterium RIFCSPLOWO2_02_FULL_48_11]OGD11759.1 MAG: hypothetical protein A2576_02770 [Candidatus Amesbacteria bacterium RIFOXYD1_FULL_47_9]
MSENTPLPLEEIISQKLRGKASRLGVSTAEVLRRALAVYRLRQSLEGSQPIRRVGTDPECEIGLRSANP